MTIGFDHLLTSCLQSMSHRSMLLKVGCILIPASHRLLVTRAFIMDQNDATFPHLNDLGRPLLNDRPGNFNLGWKGDWWRPEAISEGTCPCRDLWSHPPWISSSTYVIHNHCSRSMNSNRLITSALSMLCFTFIVRVLWDIWIMIGSLQSLD